MNIKDTPLGSFKSISSKHALFGLTWIFKGILKIFRPPKDRTRIRVTRGDIEIEVN